MTNSYRISLSSESSYDILSGNKLADLLLQCEMPSSDKALLVIDENVDKLHGSYVRNALQNHFENIDAFVVPAGEMSKSVTQWSAILDVALESGVRRNTPLFAVGGGVTGDLAGFAAASIMRGLPLFHIPTTLLAMVDSAIGGKTGVNHHTGKNLIGAFYQPQAVLIDATFLSTLPEKEWRCGLGEVLKYGAIIDTTVFEDVKRIFTEVVPVIDDELTQLIMKCARIKADIVMADEKESGVRSFLNFGHTFAHALEAYTSYSTYAHGEAVYVGMVAALHACQQKQLGPDTSKMLAFSHLYDFTGIQHSTDYEKIVAYMKQDKKNKDKDITLVLLEDWEKPVLIKEKDTKLLTSAFKFALETLEIA